MDEPLRIPFRLKGKGRGTVTTPIELSTDEEGSDKENVNHDYPGEGWFAYNPNNPEHYVIAAEKKDDVHTAKYIWYTMTDNGAFIEGCDERGGEVFWKPLKARSEDA